ncbi:hypothetical protein [Gracilibacillus boraciitolerans]|nr:hypothetical protein [Gracilibacillus boraciitolerans]
MVIKIHKKIYSAIEEVWLNDISKDYKNNHLLKEDSLKNAFYYHVRNRLGEDFLEKYNLRIFTEYFVDGERIDLVIVQIDPFRAKESYLGDCITEIIVAVEMKYKNSYTSDKVFLQDVDKVLSFIRNWKSNTTTFYLAFIHEKYMNSQEKMSWIHDKHIEIVKGKVTELNAYWDEVSDETRWIIYDH